MGGADSRISRCRGEGDEDRGLGSSQIWRLIRFGAAHPRLARGQIEAQSLITLAPDAGAPGLRWIGGPWTGGGASFWPESGAMGIEDMAAPLPFWHPDFVRPQSGSFMAARCRNDDHACTGLWRAIRDQRLMQTGPVPGFARCRRGRAGRSPATIRLALGNSKAI